MSCRWRGRRGGHDRSVRRSVAVLLLFALAAADSGPARADNGMGGIVRGFAAAGFVAELGIPDMRLVFGADDHRWVVSWPIVFTSAKLVRGDSLGIALHPFVEPQFQPTREAFRLGGGGRLLLFERKDEFQVAPLLEGGGLFGQDGSGWFGGAGLAIGVPEVGITFGLIGRVTDTDEERRYDVALDLQLPLTSDEY